MVQLIRLICLFVIAFSIGLLTAHTVYTVTMANYVAPVKPGYTTLEVSPNYGGLQTANHYNDQLTAPLTVADVNGYVVIAELHQ